MSAAAADDGACTAGTLLGGRVAYHQFRQGYRTGIEPVLLAASIPAKEGDRVVEGGTGAGAGLLCLAARVPGLSGLGLEIDSGLADLACRNVARNGWAGIAIRTADVACWRADAPFDHAFANPPWHDAAGTPSPQPGRRKAKQAPSGLLDGWAVALGSALRRGGTLSLILPAPLVAQGFAALQAAECPVVRVIPFWPRAGDAARLVILCGMRHGAGGSAILPGLTLHQAAGAYTEAAEAVLRHGGRLGGG